MQPEQLHAPHALSDQKPIDTLLAPCLRAVDARIALVSIIKWRSGRAVRAAPSTS